MLQQNNQTDAKQFFARFLIFMALSMGIVHFFFPKQQQVVMDKMAEIIAPKEAVKPLLRKITELKTDNMTIELNTNGIRLDGAVLNKYKETTAKDSGDVKVLTKDQFAEIGWVSDDKNMTVPSDQSSWSSIKTSENEIVLLWKNNKGVEFVRTYSMDENYLLTVKEVVTNKTAKELTMYPYVKMVKKFEKDEKADQYEKITHYLDESLDSIKYNDLKDEKFEYTSRSGWFGLSDQYWQTLVMVPSEDNTIRYNGVVEGGKLAIAQTDMIGEKKVIPTNGKIEYTTHLYVGAKESDVVQAYMKKYGFERLDLSINYGTFHIIAAPLAHALNGLTKWTGNMGIAIIILTLVIRLLLYPLSKKSFRSMMAMKKLQPEMKRIQNLYKTDKMRQNQELMKLYQKHKVSPMSGCLPMVLQIPILFGLYKALLISIDLRHASFLYLSDLSVADPTSIFNLFGLLPFSMPAWMPVIGLLPVLMAVTMWVQQHIQGTEQNAATPVLKYLPLIFLIMFAGLPSGLVLYWTVSNALSVAQMWLIKKQVG